MQRDFHSDNPEELLLTDVSEFAIPAGKVYLSPMVECFDGKLIAWGISEHPNADLVNGMLDDVIVRIDKKSKPIIHTDGGATIVGRVGLREWKQMDTSAPLHRKDALRTTQHVRGCSDEYNRISLQSRL